MTDQQREPAPADLRAFNHHPGASTVVHLVHNPDDHVIATRHLTAIHDVAAGRVVVLPAPDRGHSNPLARQRRLVQDILYALGKQIHQQPRRGNHDDLAAMWQDAASWLRGENTHELIVDRAHDLDRPDLQRLVALAGRAGARLWLIWAWPLDNLALQAPVTMLSVEEFITALPPSRRRRTRARSWPPLPAADFTLFLATCRHRLDTADFTRVNRLYTATYRRAAHRSNPGRWARPQTTSALSPSHLLTLLADLRDDLIGPATSPAEALIRLRATQAAFLYHGQILLRWWPELLGPKPAHQLLSDLTPQAATALRTWSRVDPAAALTIGLHLGDLPETPYGWHTDTRLGDLAPDGSTMRMRHDPLQHASRINAWPRHRPTDYTTIFPARARPVLTALYTLASTRDPDPDSPLFPFNQRPELHITTEKVRRALKIRPLIDNTPFQRRHPNASWLNRRALTLDVLPPNPRMADEWEYTQPWWPSFD